MLRKLFRSRRGAIAFATVATMVPLIGVAGLGAEASEWYLNKRHAQNAADAAAYAGGLSLACSLAGATCPETVSVSGLKTAQQNGFCNTGAGCPVTKRTADIKIGTYNAGTKSWTTDPKGSYVLATVTQEQPPILVSVLGITKFDIAGQAIAQVKQPSKAPCVLALSGAVAFNDSAVNVQAPNCGLASNATGIGIDFKANPTVNVGSLTTSGRCDGSSAQCAPVQTFAPPVVDPMKGLAAAMSGLTITKKCTGSGLKPYIPSDQCVNDKFSTNKPLILTTSGVYFFSGNAKLTGTGSIETGPGVSATLIFLPGASLDMVGGTSIKITAMASVPNSSLPTALQPSTTVPSLNGVAIVDLESGTPKTTGGSTITATGLIYFPNADLEFQGNTTTVIGSGCSELIAKSVKLIGSPKFENAGCPANTVLHPQYVAMVL